MRFFDVYRLGGAKAAHLIALQAREADAIELACAEMDISASDKRRLIARPRA